MLLSLDGCSSDGRPVRGCVNDRRIGGTGGVAECPSHAASPPVPGLPAGAAPSAVRGMIVSAALRLSDRNKRCTMVCCGGPNCSEQCSARRPRIESLTTDLSRISGAFVIGRHTAFTYKGKSVDLKQLGRELNIRYVLKGSVQRGGDRLRVNARLIDAETGNHLWADRFDKPIADLFDMQDEIVSRLANTLNTQLIEAEARRAERSLHPDAMDLYFQGIAWFNKGVTPEHMTQARGFFERALAVNPRSVEALVGMARVDLAMGASALTDDRAARYLAAETNAIKALS